MQVICTDGTVLECQRFEAIDSGVLLFGEGRTASTGEEDEEEEAEYEEAFGFVPLHSVRYVLPEGAMGGRATGQPAPQQTPGGAGQAPPPSGQPGAMPPSQQPTGGPQSGQSQPPYGQSRRQ